MDAKNDRALGVGWDRAQLSVRLTRERKAELLALCDGLGHCPTPTDAIDRALRIAQQARIDAGTTGMHAEDIEAALDAKMESLQKVLSKQSRDINEITASLRGLHRLMSSVVDESFDGVVSGFCASLSERPSFRAWLEGSIAATGTIARRAVVVRSTWQRLVSSPARTLSLELMSELIAVDGVRAASQRPTPDISRIGPLDSTHPICAAALPTPLFLVCQVSPNGWVVHAHHATLDGKPGDAIGSHRI